MCYIVHSALSDSKNSGHTLTLSLQEDRDSRYQVILARESIPKGGGRGVGWFKGRHVMLCSKLDLSMGVTLSSCDSLGTKGSQ